MYYVPMEVTSEKGKTKNTKVTQAVLFKSEALENMIKVTLYFIFQFFKKIGPFHGFLYLNTLRAASFFQIQEYKLF